MYIGAKTEDVIRNGVSTQTPKYNAMGNMNENKATMKTRRNNNIELNKGLHEAWAWYDKCYMRERNQGKIRYFVFE